VIATFKAVRHFLRANPALRAQGCPYPEYSAGFERMVAFVEGIRPRLGHSRWRRRARSDGGLLHSVRISP